MYNIFPADGLGYEASRLLVYGLGYNNYAPNPDIDLTVMTVSASTQYEADSIPVYPIARGV